jgi:hypothetical protein
MILQIAHHAILHGCGGLGDGIKLAFQLSQSGLIRVLRGRVSALKHDEHTNTRTKTKPNDKYENCIHIHYLSLASYVVSCVISHHMDANTHLTLT